MADQKYLYADHRPVLEDGTYEISVLPRFTIDQVNLFDSRPYSLTFEVAGEKYSLNPQLVDAVFPPAAAMGEYPDILPHILLNRSTLPWERSANTTNIKDSGPWLALFSYPESEASDYPVKQVPVKDFDKSDPATDIISVIYNTGPTPFSDNLPNLAELSCLVHVRGEAGKEIAVIIGNRLPAKGEKNTVHLVSVENCYDRSGNLVASTDALVSLYSWSFFCTEHFIFTGEVLDLLQNRTDDKGNKLLDINLYKYLDNKCRGREFFSWQEFMTTVKDPVIKKNFDQNKDLLLSYFDLGHLANILKHLHRGPLKISGDSAGKANAAGNAGYSTIPYTTKDGKQIKVYYRGPLIPFKPGSNEEKDFEPVRHSDQLFRTVSIAGTDQLDISYAAAWELGRLLCLQHKNVSLAIFQWKRKYYQLKKGMGNNDDHDHLPNINTYEDADLPPIVINYISDLLSLKVLPFNYLVPGEAMLPFESIRFFYTDPLWFKCLVDGVFSIGRLSDNDLGRDRIAWKEHVEKLLPDNFSGFFIRSTAVTGWPNLEVVPGDAKIAVTRKELLSPNVMVCLFDGMAGKFSIHQQPETLHFNAGDEQVSGGNISFRGTSKSVITFPDTTKSSSAIAKDLIAKLERVGFQGV